MFVLWIDRFNLNSNGKKELSLKALPYLVVECRLQVSWGNADIPFSGGAHLWCHFMQDLYNVYSALSQCFISFALLRNEMSLVL